MIHFIDVETSGTTESDEILECAIVVWNNGKRQVRYHKHFFCQGILSPEAQAINGYVQDVWWKKHDAQWLTANYAGELAQAIQDCEVMGGFAPAFSRRFLFSTFKRMRMKYPSFGRSTVDVAALAAPLMVAGKLPDLSPETVCKALGVTNQRGNALSGANAACDVFEELVSIYWNGFK